MKTLILILLSALTGFAQSIPPPTCQQMNCYTASTGQVSLSSAATAATIQQPPVAPFQQMYGIKATVQCSVTCTVTRSYGGTKATATAGTIVQSPFAPTGVVAAQLLFFTASNVSGGTTIDVTTILNGGELLFDLSDVVFGSQPNQNYTIAIASMTGTANITYYLGLK